MQLAGTSLDPVAGRTGLGVAVQTGVEAAATFPAPPTPEPRGPPMPEPITSLETLDADLRRVGFRPERPTRDPDLCALQGPCPACGRATVAYRSYVAPAIASGPYGHRGLAVCESCDAAWVLA
jgi:hypothetical protein